MNKKILLTMIFTATILLSSSAVSAFMPYGYQTYSARTHTYQNYMYQPVRVGGWFGQGTALTTNINPGYFDNPYMSMRTRHNLYNNYNSNVRVGGSYYRSGYTYTLRPTTLNPYVITKSGLRQPGSPVITKRGLAQ